MAGCHLRNCFAARGADCDSRRLVLVWNRVLHIVQVFLYFAYQPRRDLRASYIKLYAF